MVVSRTERASGGNQSVVFVSLLFYELAVMKI